MRKKVFIFIESNTSGTGEIFVYKVQDLEIHPILLTSNPSQYHFLSQGIEVIYADTTSEKKLLQICQNIAQQNKLAGIASSSEYFVEIAAKLAKSFNLPGPNPVAISTCRNKEKQRAKLLKAGIAVPEYKKAISVKSAAEFACKTGFPVVIKPVSGSGSVGVALCSNLNEVIEHSEILLRQAFNERGISQSRGILVEQFIEGEEYSVEVFGGKIIGVTKKYLGTKPYFVETGHDFPAFISNEIRTKISQAVLKSLDALNLNWGPSHTEVRVNEKGIFIIEVNPRLAGGFIPELIRYSLGIDLIAETINLLLGRKPILTSKSQYYSSIRFVLSSMTGTLTTAEGIEKARQLAGIEDVILYKKSGEKVTNFGDFRDRIGHVIAKGKNPKIACEASEKARNLIELIISSDTE